MKKTYNKRSLVRYTVRYKKNGKKYSLTFNAYGGRGLWTVLRGWDISEEMIISVDKF